MRTAAIVGIVLMLSACGTANPGAASSPTGGAQPAPLAISSLTFPNAEVGVPITPFTLGANGGVPPYLWRVSPNSFPAGLELGTGGAVMGTPARAGTFEFTLAVQDQRGTTLTIDASMVVAPPLSATLSKSGTVLVETGHAVGAFATQSGGVPPYRYTLKSGRLPAGTSLSSLSLAGAPSAAGSYSFTVVVMDSFGVTAAVSPSYLVFAPLAFATSDAYCSGVVATGCKVNVSYSGGYPGSTPALAWYLLDQSGNRVTCYPAQPRSCSDLATPALSGGALRIVFNSDRTGVLGGIGWTGQVVATITDPVTRDTSTVHVHVHVTQ